MFFNIGTKVILIHTGDEGIVTELLGDGMVNVRLYSDAMEIPTFEEDLVRADTYVGVPVSKQKEKEKAIVVPAPILKYHIIKSLGIQIAFEAVIKYENIDKYRIFLVNDTPYNAILQLEIFVGNQLFLAQEIKSDSISANYVGDMLYDHLNDGIEIDIECWQLTTEGKSEPLFKTLKIKPKAFFKSTITVPLLNKEMHHYVVFENFSLPKKTNEEDLKTYTKRQASPIKKSNVIHVSNVRRARSDVQEYANFSPEIDLHIENLIADYSKLTNGEIITIQLKHFEKFMLQAERLGIDRVFVIHGIGKGKLRDSITTRLLQGDFRIETFRNEYHPRYGWGATEIIFR
jgi:hypothetical protein